MPDKPEQSFTFETVAVILCCMMESGVNLGTKHYKMMSAIDGNRGEAAFQHQFRKVKARAKELHEQSGNGEVSNPVQKGRAKGTKSSTPASGKKRGRKAAAEYPSDHEEDQLGEEESPSKKVKVEVKKETAEDETADSEDLLD